MYQIGRWNVLGRNIMPGKRIGNVGCGCCPWWADEANAQALLECGAFALHLSTMCQTLRAMHFPQTQIFWLIVSQVMPELLANKSI